MSEEVINSVPLNDIEAKSIARRNKILNHAKERLRKLNGRSSDDDDDTDVQVRPRTTRSFSDPEIETEELFGPGSRLSNPASSQHQDNGFHFMSTSNFDDDIGAELLYNLSMNKQATPSSNLNSNPPEKQLDTKLNRFLKTKMHLIIISVLTYIFFASENDYGSSVGIFLPLLMWELTEAFFLKTNDNQKNLMFNLVLMMSGIPPTVGNVLLKVLGTLDKVFKDVGVFVFFFVCCHLVFNYKTPTSLLSEEV